MPENYDTTTFINKAHLYFWEAVLQPLCFIPPYAGALVGLRGL
jgi:hypothetical protein